MKARIEKRVIMALSIKESEQIQKALSKISDQMTGVNSTSVMPAVLSKVNSCLCLAIEEDD